MKHLMNRLVTVLFVAVAALFVAFVLWDQYRSANTSPQITCDSDVLTVSIHDDQSMLLTGVTATDKEDGDLTDRIMIENISNFIERGVCHVTYAVQDENNAVAKLTRTLQYTDYTPPRFSLKAPLVFDYGKSFDPTEYVQAQDCIDGDLSDHVRMTLLEDDMSITGVGDWNVRFRVTNSMGETAYLTTVVKVRSQGSTEKRYTPNIRLKEYITYLPVGASFDAKSYVSGVSVSADDAPDNPVELSSRLRINSDVDTGKPGVYTVTYSCTSSNRYTGTADLIVVVGDISE